MAPAKIPCPLHPAKARYASRADAERNIARAWATGRAKTLPIRSYACRACGGWHTTSQPRRSR